MLNMNLKMARHAADGQEIQVGIVGAGQMGRGIISQLVRLPGLRPAIICARHLESCMSALQDAGLSPDQIAEAKTLTQANTLLGQGKYVICQDPAFVSQADLVDCVVDVTGVPDSACKVALSAINHRKHCVMMSVEADVVIGPYLKHLADQAGVIYTGTAGDEPGAVNGIYQFAKAIGFEVAAIGKGKNNPLDHYCSPDLLAEEARQRKMSARMLTSFKDGSNTMVELACMANATGLVPDIPGAHGTTVQTVADLNQRYLLTKDGGILNRWGVVEYAHGIAPGVYATVYTDNPEATYQLRYLAMGDGPLWTLYHNYHLISLETPLSIAKAVWDHEPTIVPHAGLVAEVTCRAKTDLKKGQTLDGIGGSTVYGCLHTAEEARASNYLPLGLINDRAVMLQDVKKDTLLTYDMVALDQSQVIYQIRQEQSKIGLG